ncbi:hypothetical protein V5799_016882, partial [Amblyomma americanum]
WRGAVELTTFFSFLAQSNPEEEDLNESEYGGSGDDDDERRTPLDGELSNDDAQSDVLARYQPHNISASSAGNNGNSGNNGSLGSRSRQDEGSPIPLANSSSNHSSSTPPASNGSTPSTHPLGPEPRIPAPNAVVSSSPGPMRVPDSGPLSVLAARAAAVGLPLPAAAISALPLSQAPPLFSLATAPPHMMHLPPTLTPHTAAVSSSPSEPNKYAFEEQYGKHLSISNLTAVWMADLTKSSNGVSSSPRPVHNGLLVVSEQCSRAVTPLPPVSKTAMTIACPGRGFVPSSENAPERWIRRDGQPVWLP